MSLEKENNFIDKSLVPSFKPRYYYETLPGFDAIPFPSKRPKTINELWLPYFDEFDSAKEFSDFMEDVEEFDNLSIVAFVFFRPKILNILKESISFRAKTSPNISNLVGFEIHEVEQMFKQDTSTYYGLWWPIVKWAFDKVINQRPLNMGYVRFMWLESEIRQLIYNKAPIKFSIENYEFAGKYLTDYPYNVYWLECLHYIEEGGSYAFYLDYLKQNINNPTTIGEHVSPVIKLLFNGSNRQLCHVIWQLRNYKALPEKVEDIAKFFADTINFKDGKKHSWKAIRRLISNKDEEDVMPTKGMAHKRFTIQWLPEESTEHK